MRLRLPLTLAILPVLLVRVREELYALPLRAVVETARVRKEEVHRVEGRQVLRLRQETLPLVADDSAFMRRALTRMIESEPAMRVIGTAQTGVEALEKTVSLQPDVVRLDVGMPRMNGLETLKLIMKDSPRPVIMVSSLTREGADTTLEALDCGAFDCLPKQSSYASLDIVKMREDLVSKIRAAAESKRPRARRISPTPIPQVCVHSFQVTPSVVALGTSTGGPKALQQILPMFPEDLPGRC